MVTTIAPNLPPDESWGDFSCFLQTILEYDIMMLMPIPIPVRQQKILPILIIVDIMAILIAIIIVAVHYAKTATIDIDVVPTDATVTLNGKRYDNLQSHDILPGDYHVEIAMEGMRTEEYDLSLQSGDYAKIWKYLVDENGGLDYYLKNPKEISALARFKDDENVSETIDYYNKIVSIRNVLPLEYYDRSDTNNPIGVFIEENTDDCDNETLCLYVYGGEKNKDIAMGLIRDAGYQPNDYGIRYEDE